MAPKFHKPFSPAIMETQVPDRFIEIVNTISDKVLDSDSASQEWDWSHKLVGKVHKEVRIPMTDKEESGYCLKVMKKACLEYLKFFEE